MSMLQPARRLPNHRRHVHLLLAAALTLASCAHATAQGWCETFCGDREAEASEHSSHEVAIATCHCSAPIKEQFDIEVEKSISR